MIEITFKGETLDEVRNSCAEFLGAEGSAAPAAGGKGKGKTAEKPKTKAPVTIDTIREAAVKKVNTEVKAVLADRGYAKMTEIAAEDYDAVLAEIEALTDKD